MRKKIVVSNFIVSEAETANFENYFSLTPFCYNIHSLASTAYPNSVLYFYIYIYIYICVCLVLYHLFFLPTDRYVSIYTVNMSSPFISNVQSVKRYPPIPFPKQYYMAWKNCFSLITYMLAYISSLLCIICPVSQHVLYILIYYRSSNPQYL